MNTQHAKVEDACKLVASTFYGRRGRWLYQAFDAINRDFFFNQLPYPLIILSLTAHGRCLGWASSVKERPPQIAIHPSNFGGTERDEPWDIPATWLGDRFAFDVLVHECIHVSIDYRLGGHSGPTSHNSPEWVAEVNRLAPLLGFKNIEAGLSKTRRVPVEGKKTKRGKKPTKVARCTDGNIPFKIVATFPSGLRVHQGTAEQFYRRGILPVQNILKPSKP